MKARNAECKCDPRFTCGYCLRNAPPYFFTLSDGSAIYESRVQGTKSTTIPDESATNGAR
jgi:hypothetical protein